MAYQLVGIDMDITDHTKQEILGKVGKLDKFLTHLPDDTFFLRIALNKDQQNPRWTDALLDLALPGDKLMSRGKASTPEHAVHLAVLELERQLERWKHEKERPYS